MSIGRQPQQGQGIGQPDFPWLLGLAGGNNRLCQDIVAHPGGGAAAATPMGVANSQGLEAGLIDVTTVASADDSVQLPQAVAGKTLLVFNSTATSANCYANPNTNRATGSTDTINGSATATAYALAAGISVLFYCPHDGVWAALKSA